MTPVRCFSIRSALGGLTTRVSRVCTALALLMAGSACTLPPADTPTADMPTADTPPATSRLADTPRSASAAAGSAVSAEAAESPALTDATSPNATTRDRCEVRTVSDGDSLRCADGRRVRLLLLDAPEMSQTPFGTRSRDALRARLPRGKTVWLEFDVQRLDRYDRTLAYIWTGPVGGELINVAHARDGWAVAVVFPPNVRRIAEVRQAVADARRGRRGLWADAAFTCEPIERKRGRC